MRVEMPTLMVTRLPVGCPHGRCRATRRAGAGPRRSRPPPARGARQDDRELLAAVARDQRALVAHARGDRGSDLLQAAVAAAVAVQVVVGLEVVDVDHDQRDRLAVPGRVMPRALQRLVEAAAVGEQGQAVGRRQLAQAVLEQLLLGDVAEHHHEVLHLALRVEHAVHARVEREAVAVGAARPQRAFPVAAGVQARAHLLQRVLVVVEQRRRLAERALDVVAGDAHKARVGADHAQLGIEHEHALAGVAHHGVGQAQAFLRGLELAAAGARAAR